MGGAASRQVTTKWTKRWAVGEVQHGCLSHVPWIWTLQNFMRFAPHINCETSAMQRGRRKEPIPNCEHLGPKYTLFLIPCH